MKTLLAIAVLSLGLSAQAESTAKPAGNTTAPAAAAASAHKGEVKPTAKEACLKENPKLMGAELDACVKGKEKTTK